MTKWKRQLKIDLETETIFHVQMFVVCQSGKHNLLFTHVAGVKVNLNEAVTVKDASA